MVDTPQVGTPPIATTFPRVDVLGVAVSAINMEQALSAIDDWIARRERNYICITGVHGVMESQRDDELCAIHNNAGMVTPDGMPLVWLSRLQGYKHVSRVYGPDLMLALCRRSVEKRYRHYFYGGGTGVPELLAQRLTHQIPGLQVVGTYSPPFRVLSREEDEAVVARINRAKPDVLWVGLSTPKQEQWMHRHIDRVEAPVMIGVGAAFDFHAGLKKQAPSWMQRSGLEWSFRLAMEPRRLWRRYLMNNPRFIFEVIRQGGSPR